MRSEFAAPLLHYIVKQFGSLVGCELDASLPNGGDRRGTERRCRATTILLRFFGSQHASRCRNRNGLLRAACRLRRDWAPAPYDPAPVRARIAARCDSDKGRFPFSASSASASKAALLCSSASTTFNKSAVHSSRACLFSAANPYRL